MLGQAVRKIITRFLNDDNSNYYNWPITFFLKEKPELWNDEYLSNENITKFEEEIDEFDDILVNQSVHFYEILENKKREKSSKKKTNKENDESKKKSVNKNKSIQTTKKMNLDY